MRHVFRTVLGEAAIVAAASSLLALGVNAVRPDGLPLVARAPYEVLVPCPEPGGEVVPMPAGDPSLGESRTFVIDARDGEAFRNGRFPGAVNVPYDWLDPLGEEELGRLARQVASSGATRVVVYGDGGHPDSGEHLGRELSGRGIRNVAFVVGGAPALLSGGSP
jgi:rhodanese-related sulfurtransferase